MGYFGSSKILINGYQRALRKTPAERIYYIQRGKPEFRQLFLHFLIFYFFTFFLYQVTNISAAFGGGAALNTTV
jgi:hypothetical protein